MLPTLGRVFVTETLTEGISELADEGSSRGIERVGSLVELSSVGSPASEA